MKQKIVFFIFIISLICLVYGAAEEKKINYILVASKGSGHAQITQDASKYSTLLKTHFKKESETNKSETKLIYSIKDDSLTIDIIKLYTQLLNIADEIAKDKTETTEKEFKTKIESFDFKTLFDLYRLAVLLNTPFLENLIANAIDDAALKSKNFILDLTQAISKKLFTGFAGLASKLFIKYTKNILFDQIVATYQIQKDTVLKELYMSPMAISPRKNIIAILSQSDKRKNSREYIITGSIKIYDWINQWIRISSVNLPVSKAFIYAIPLLVNFNSDGSRLAVLTKNTNDNITNLLPIDKESHVVHIINSSNKDPKNWKIISSLSTKLGNISSINFSATDPKLLITGNTKGVIELFYEEKNKYNKFDELKIKSKDKKIINKPITAVFSHNSSLFIEQDKSLYYFKQLEDESYGFVGQIGQNIQKITFDEEGKTLAKIETGKSFIEIEKLKDKKLQHVQKISKSLTPTSIALNSLGSQLAIGYADQTNKFKNSAYLSILKKAVLGNFSNPINLPILDSSVALQIKHILWNNDSSILLINAESEFGSTNFGYQIYMFAQNFDRLPVIQLWLIQIIDKLSKKDGGMRQLQVYLPQILDALSNFPKPIAMAVIEKYNLKS